MRLRLPSTRGRFKGAALSALLLLSLAAFVPAPSSPVVVVVRASPSEVPDLETAIAAALRKQRIDVDARSNSPLSVREFVSISDRQATDFAKRAGATVLVIVDVEPAKVAPIRATAVVGTVRTVSWRILRLDSANQGERREYKIAGFGKTASAAAADVVKRIARTVGPLVARTLRVRWPEETKLRTDSGYVVVHLNGVTHWRMVSQVTKHLKKSLGRSSVQVRGFDGRGGVVLRIQSPQSESVRGVLRGIPSIRDAAEVSLRKNAIYVRWAGRGRDGA